MPLQLKVFLITWIVLGIASWVFYKKASYQTKKAAHPIIMIVIGVLFIAFTEWVMPATSYQLPATSYQLPATSYQLPATS